MSRHCHTSLETYYNKAKITEKGMYLIPIIVKSGNKHMYKGIQIVPDIETLNIQKRLISNVYRCDYSSDYGRFEDIKEIVTDFQIINDKLEVLLK